MYSGAPYSVSPEIGRRLKNGGRGKAIHAQITRRNQGELNRPVPLYANLSHRGIRTSRIRRYESLASLEGNASPRSEGAVRIARIGHAGLLFVAWQTDRHKMNAYLMSAPRKRTRFYFCGRNSEIYKPYLTMCHFSVHPTRCS